jgi:hypothetical protein
MNPGLTSALAVVMGACVGGLASLASTWIGEHHRNKLGLLQAEIVKRERVYSLFIEKASSLLTASLTHRLDDDESQVGGLVTVYAVTSRMRLFASEQVIIEAGKVVALIIEQFGDENLSAKQLRTSASAGALEGEKDPLKDFSITCRRELKGLRSGIVKNLSTKRD